MHSSLSSHVFDPLSLEKGPFTSDVCVFAGVVVGICPQRVLDNQTQTFTHFLQYLVFQS